MIKFRAWQREEDEEYSRMIRSEQSVLTAIRHVYGGAGIATGSGFSDINNQPEPGRYELMQYTGLKDKNGKEIYEKDVISSISSYQKEYGIVEFVDGAFCLVITSSRTTLSGSKYFLSTCKELEVIGNIYENPELVEVK